tara:strand:+ start:364 stop:561 length:198 start_codon:yes stop_codon:yes gene_type:complete
MKNYQAILLVTVGFTLGVQTMNGVLQSYIQFGGVKNEMAFAITSILMGVLGLFAINYKKLIKGLF